MRKSAQIIDVGNPNWKLDTDFVQPISNMAAALKGVDIITPGVKTNFIALLEDSGVYFVHASVLTVNGYIASDKDNTSSYVKSEVIEGALLYISKQKNTDFIILASEHFIKDLKPLVEGLKSIGVRVKSTQTVEGLLSVFS